MLKKFCRKCKKDLANESKYLLCENCHKQIILLQDDREFYENSRVHYQPFIFATGQNKYDNLILSYKVRKITPNPDHKDRIIIQFIQQSIAFFWNFKEQFLDSFLRIRGILLYLPRNYHKRIGIRSKLTKYMKYMRFIV